ncbi:MAG: TIGR00266 family protein [Dehalococcoidia bacterium]|nr:TIGR00266 family protein [Dehalococcoidia bacterium]
MESEILYQPSYSLARVRLNAGEAITAEAGAMVSMSEGITIETSVKGGFLAGLKRSFLGGESFFMNTFKAGAPGEITFAPPLPGDIVHFRLSGETILVQSSSYIASSPDISVDTKWAGAKGFFAKEGLFLLKVQGTGDLFLSSYGAIHEIKLSAGESYTIDNGHMVAFDESVNYKIKRVGGIKSTLFSGEGLVCTYTGSGRIFMQTRSEDAFLSWLIPHLPRQGNSGSSKGVGFTFGR